MILPVAFLQEERPCCMSAFLLRFKVTLKSFVEHSTTTFTKQFLTCIQTCLIPFGRSAQYLLLLYGSASQGLGTNQMHEFDWLKWILTAV